ncbi:MAG: TrkH family potassium uptake protein [Bacteroidaceae bacterium]|nr:TrkH family potassium uptake protein [Bacteroidaceae bacterium]
MIHLKTIFRIIGSLLLLLSGIFFLFSIASPFLAGNDLFGFLVSALTTMLVGLWCCVIGKGSNGEFSRRDSYITITVCWIAFALFGSLPYWLGGHIPDFTDAFFESMSGFTTTGASILDNIESQPHALLLWRSLTQWLGGLGIVFFTVAILPMFGIDKVQLFATESTGVNQRKVHSRISVGSRWIFSIYMLLTAACAVSLKVCGMDWFDAVNHALTTIATSGFSTKQASIGAFDSAQIEYVVTLFMFLSGINFTLLYLLLFKGKLRELYRNTEFRVYLFTVLGFTLFITLGLWRQGDLGIDKAFRVSLFQVVSLQTTTGFATADYMQWPPYLWMFLSFIMFFGACGGSSTGAMKCGRVAILAKSIRGEFRRILHPNAVIPVRMDGNPISQDTRATVLTFTCLYFLLIFFGWFVFMFMGLDFVEGYSISVSCVGNIGPALGTLGPAYSWSALPASAKWLSTLLMLIGRLELFTILLMFTASFWKKR